MRRHTSALGFAIVVAIFPLGVASAQVAPGSPGAGTVVSPGAVPSTVISPPPSAISPPTSVVTPPAATVTPPAASVTPSIAPPTGTLTPPATAATPGTSPRGAVLSPPTRVTPGATTVPTGAVTTPGAATPGAPLPSTVTPGATDTSSPSAIPGSVVPPAPLAAPTPGDPNNPGDFASNPHPTMPWFGVATPYGQFLRWVWVPPRRVALDGGGVIDEPGFMAAQTTNGIYYPERWTVARAADGYVWRLAPGAFQAR
jgi:hypothetical protein